MKEINKKKMIKLLYIINPLFWLWSRRTKHDVNAVLTKLSYSFFVGFIYGALGVTSLTIYLVIKLIIRNHYSKLTHDFLIQLQ